MNKQIKSCYVSKKNTVVLYIKYFIFLSIMNYSNLYSLESDADKPIEVSADSVVIDEIKGLSIFKGDAIITQGSLMLKAEIVELYTDKKEVKKAIAKGSSNNRAYYKQNQPKQPRFVEATAITITYSLDKQYIYLRGDANLIQGFDSFSAGTLEYDIDNDKVIAEKSKQNIKTGEPVKRVKFKISF
jgi:lipopolysaccharide export system protein LptA